MVRITRRIRRGFISHEDDPLPMHSRERGISPKRFPSTYHQSIRLALSDLATAHRPHPPRSTTGARSLKTMSIGKLEVRGSTSVEDGVMSWLRRFARTIFPFYLSFSTISCCTILRSGGTTPRIACDSKSPMISRLGPLARPRFPVRYLIDSRAWPSPLWAYNVFSHVLFFSFRFTSPLCSIPFCSIPFRVRLRSHFTSIRFRSILFYSYLSCSL